jgi:hypothetical protein
MSDSIVSLILAGLLSFFAVQILFSLATQIRIYRLAKLTAEAVA